jgi:D-alanyl-D-alanine carboxypeptidase
MRPVAEPAPPAHAASRIAPGSTEPIRAIRVKTLTVRPGALKTAALAPIDPGPQITPQRNAAPAPAPIQAAAAPPVAPPPAPRETVASAEPIAPATAAPTAPEMRRSGWIIQIGAFPAEDEAKERLKSARTVAKSLLGRADPFTERVVKGETTLFRARFAGLDEDRAEAACKQLKRNKIACFAVKN